MRHWLRSYGLLLRWTLLRQRMLLPLMVVVQTLIGCGVVVGFSFLAPEIDRATALYLATGAPTVVMIVMGMVAAPQEVAGQKRQGIFDYYRAMPVPRLAMLAADATVWVVLAIPGILLALAFAAWRFDLDLTVSPLVVPAFLLVAVAGVAVGYGIAYACRPQVTQLISQVVVFIALMFAPVNFPADRLPDWLATVHEWLPFQYMAQAVRETLDVPAGGVSVLPFAVLAAWGIAGLAVTYRIMARRA
ncbi:MAG TPA: ABC transporter permease [Natronosporangium sp.]